MKKIAYFAGGIAVAASMATIAGSFTAPNSFTGGTTISATEMNANFDAVKTAVDDNDARITTLESGSTCPSDMVPVGPICVDIYEASVWNSTDGTGTQYGVGSDDYASAGESSAGANDGCQNNGDKCNTIFAVSKSGVIPSTDITWFQAQQACANVGKRLLTNAEWQMAAAGTDETKCSTTLAGPTGAQVDCQSVHGVHDMARNVHEWVAGWVTNPQDSTTPAQVLVDNTQSLVRAVYRGGGAGGGIFTYNANEGVHFSGNNVGFRCAK